MALACLNRYLIEYQEPYLYIGMYVIAHNRKAVGGNEKKENRINEKPKPFLGEFDEQKLESYIEFTIMSLYSITLI